jgi:hypothetical protein
MPLTEAATSTERGQYRTNSPRRGNEERGGESREVSRTRDTLRARSAYRRRQRRHARVALRRAELRGEPSYGPQSEPEDAEHCCLWRDLVRYLRSDHPTANNRPVAHVRPNINFELPAEVVISPPLPLSPAEPEPITINVPPYAVYFPADVQDTRLTTLEEAYPSYFYLPHETLLNLTLGLIPMPMALQRVSIPPLSNDFPPPAPYDTPFQQWG